MISGLMTKPPVLCVTVCAACIALLSACGGAGDTAPSPGTAQTGKFSADYHIAVVTGSSSVAGDEYRGILQLVASYGSAQEGGLIRHLTYPDGPVIGRDALVAMMSKIADDPLTKAVVLYPAYAGTAEAMKLLREKRPDIILLVMESSDDPLVIEEAVDLVMGTDPVGRGYASVWAARELGADAFVHISTDTADLSAPALLRMNVMKKACTDMGLDFIPGIFPGSLDDDAAVALYMAETVPAWIRENGVRTAFFCAEDEFTDVLLPQLFKHGGFFIEGNHPSPTAGFPRALGMDVQSGAIDYPAILKQIEQSIIDADGAGRFGTWAYGYGFSATVGLVEFAKAVIDGKTTLDSVDGLSTALQKHTPGARLHVANYVDSESGVRTRNHVLMYMDTYVFGKGYLPTTRQLIPREYYSIRSDS